MYRNEYSCIYIASNLFIPVLRSFAPVFGSQAFEFGIPFHYFAVIAAYMGKDTVSADLDALFRIPEIAAALVSQGIQGAITEQAVEILRLGGLMTGEILAL